VRRQKECRRLNAAIANAFEQLEAGHTRHRDVENEAIKSSSDGSFESGHAAFSLFNLKPEPAEVFRQQEPHIRIVICDEKTLACVFVVW
jgi:hypothetical protein